jgi:hypothetical protein
MLVGAFSIPMAMGGCDMKCDCDGNEVEDVVDDIGDEIDDAVDNLGG